MSGLQSDVYRYIGLISSKRRITSEEITLLINNEFMLLLSVCLSVND